MGKPKRKAVMTEQETASSGDEETETSGVKKTKVHKMSAAARIMKPEAHPWLNWPGCDSQRKIELDNRLAELQERPICQPRFMDWDLTRRLGIAEELDNMFETKSRNEAMLVEVPIWSRVLNLKEPIYREWCLEFYSSLKVEKKFKLTELWSKKLISFRLGKQEHSVSIPKFGVLTGLITEDECRNKGNMYSYLADGKMDSRDFLPDIDEVWFGLTGIPKHTSTSKTSAIRVPILRVVHKLLTYSFIHRSTQHDKVYAEDLWLLHTFNQRDPFNYVCVPWVLACYMESKGAGRQRDSQICCGHFITKIAKNLKLFTQANVRQCSPPVNWREITMLDLDASKLVNAEGTGLIDQGEAPTQPPPPRQQRGQRDETMFNEIMRIGQSMNRMELKVDGVISHYNYHMERYQPYMERMAANEATSSGSTWTPYAPPQFYVPPEEMQEEEDEE